MLPDLRPDLPVRPPVLPSAAVRLTKFLFVFCGGPSLRFSCPHVPRQPAFLPSSTSSSRPPTPRPVPRCCCLPHRSRPTRPCLVPPVVIVQEREIKGRRRKEESRKKNNNRRRTCHACLPPLPSRPALPSPLASVRLVLLACC